MLKIDELSKPSCFKKAKLSEYIFVLIEREATPETIRFWCAERIRKGKNRPDDEQIVEALAGADYVEKRLALDNVVPCAQAVGLTTCGYTERNHLRADGSPMDHEFVSVSNA